MTIREDLDRATDATTQAAEQDIATRANGPAPKVPETEGTNTRVGDKFRIVVPRKDGAR